jgi:hypothetical protein
MFHYLKIIKPPLKEALLLTRRPSKPLGEFQYNPIVKVNIGNLIGIKLYPNPLKGNALTLEMNNLVKGAYILTLYNNHSQLVLSKKIDHPGGSASQIIALDSELAAGVYLVRLSGEDETFVQQLIKAN